MQLDPITFGLGSGVGIFICIFKNPGRCPSRCLSEVYQQHLQLTGRFFRSFRIIY